MKVLSSKALLIPLLLGLLLLLFVVLRHPSGSLSDLMGDEGDRQEVITLQWQDLLEMNYKTGEASPKLKSVHKKKVRFPGFVVPLTDNVSNVREFLLVPDPMACIHLPPPPPNQMVYVKMVSEMAIPTSYEPIWVNGRFALVETESKYGESSFQIDGVSTEPYEWKD